MHACMHACIHTYMHSSLHACIHMYRGTACMHACMHSSLHACIHMYRGNDVGAKECNILCERRSKRASDIVCKMCKRMRGVRGREGGDGEVRESATNHMKLTRAHYHSSQLSHIVFHSIHSFAVFYVIFFIL